MTFENSLKRINTCRRQFIKDFGPFGRQSFNDILLHFCDELNTALIGVERFLGLHTMRCDM